MNLSRAALVTLVASIGCMAGGALIVTFTNLGILGWVLILVGFVAEVIAISRRRLGQQ